VLYCLALNELGVGFCRQILNIWCAFIVQYQALCVAGLVRYCRNNHTSVLYRTNCVLFIQTITVSRTLAEHVTASLVWGKKWHVEVSNNEYELEE
jgi:hypothetical protein